MKVDNWTEDTGGTKLGIWEATETAAVKQKSAVILPTVHNDPERGHETGEENG